MRRKRIQKVLIIIFLMLRDREFAIGIKYSVSETIDSRGAKSRYLQIR